MLYITSLGGIYFITGSLHLWTPFTHFAHTQPPTSGNHEPLIGAMSSPVVLDLNKSSVLLHELHAYATLKGWGLRHSGAFCTAPAEFIAKVPKCNSVYVWKLQRFERRLAGGIVKNNKSFGGRKGIGREKRAINPTHSSPMVTHNWMWWYFLLRLKCEDLLWALRRRGGCSMGSECHKLE